MQINNNSLTLSQSIGQTLAIDQNKVLDAKSGATSSGGDTVELSSFAAQLAADPSRLEQLQSAYQAGMYQVSPSQIANSMINDAIGN